MPRKTCIPVTEVQGNETASHALGPVGHIGATDAHLGSGAAQGKAPSLFRMPRCACWLVNPTDCGYIVIKMCIYQNLCVCHFINLTVVRKSIHIYYIYIST
jgi:hypothetical protein